MVNLINLANLIFLGAYANMPSCQNARYEIVATRLNPVGQRLPELEKPIQTSLQYDKTLICIPVKKF